MYIKDLDSLTSWLIRELKPICDAEPPVLAKYVLSLIRKPDKTDEEIMKFCSTQLEVFLQGNTKRFVEKMFATITDGSYMEVEKGKPREEKRPAKEEKHIEDTKPITSKEAKPEARKAPTLAPRKEESIKKDESRIVRKRISPPAEAEKEALNRRRSRSPANRRDRRRSPARRHKRSRSRSYSGDRDHRKSDDTRKRRRCRDYYEKGVCTRGDLCQFDHGTDPVVFDREAMDIMPMGSLPKSAPPPNLSVPPPGYNPINPPPNSGAVEGYNPEAPAISSANYSVPPPPLPSQMSQAPWHPTLYTVNSANLAVYDHNFGGLVDPTAIVHGVVRGRGRGRGGSLHTGTPHFNRNIIDGNTNQVSHLLSQEDYPVTKFVNANFSAHEKAKVKKKELQSKLKGILDAQKKQMTLLDSLIKQQKNILGKLKEEIVDVEAKRRLKELAKATNEQIIVARTMNASLAKQLEENSQAMKEVEDTLSSTVAQKSPLAEAPNGINITA